jgi:hypothetical protein
MKIRVTIFNIMRLTQPLTTTSLLKLIDPVNKAFEKQGHSRDTGLLSTHIDNSKALLSTMITNGGHTEDQLTIIPDEVIQELFQPEAMSVTKTGIDLKPNSTGEVTRRLGEFLKNLDRLFSSAREFLSKAPNSIKVEVQNFREGIESISDELKSFFSDILNNPTMSGLKPSVEKVQGRFVLESS